ncbi:MAG: ATP-dependent zinc metalloprotease FtsH [Actinobacteria bacterium]|nr:MAG: ATP-dependent zinc metalloprotease FtsH [Actinomycetota bacterium]TMK91681.1 MAG: ATP-dependent zinc metalloprotease FtsH [Actinomycetota bacterium]TMM22387.1 MAG: ATP-dependent zinc metalloprotease FtsH [Actinomycetota bacterium]
MPDNDKNDRRRSGPDGPSGPGIPRTRLTPWILIALVVLALVAFNQWFSTASRQSIDLSRFYQLVDEGKITPGTKVTISATQVTGTYTADDGTQKSFVATLPGSNYDPSTTLEPKLQAKGIDYTGTQPSPWFSLLASILPLVLLMGIAYYFLFRRVGGGAANPLNMGKNKVKIYDRKEMKTTFSDVAGVDEAKEELKEIVEFLKNPKKYQRLGGRIPKGVLLLGPPGCGKTLLARAVAGEANVPFFFMSGSEFVEMFVGLGAARVRELFQQAKEKAPALVFLDEIDTIGKGRSGVMGAGFGAHDEREQTLNQLLVEMDGFDSSKGVIIMAATNRPDVLDPALVRPGRFDRQVVVDPPDLRGREEILRVHARGVALDPSDDLRTIAQRTPGFTGADLENVVNEAALLAARREKNSVTMDELEEAIDRASMGLERKSRVISDREKVRVAAHEMGHALVAHFCENLDPVHRVTIVARGTAALGLTMTRPLEDRYMATEPELRDMLAFAMGGRVAEEVVFGEVSTGAQNDLEKATQIARAMVAEYGMSDKVGPLSLGRDDPNAFWQQPKISGETAQLIDQETRRLLDEAHDKAERILKERRQLLDELRDLLLVVETIDGNDIEAYATGTKSVPDPDTARREQDERAAAAAAVASKPAPAVHARPSRAPVIPPAPPLPAD